MGTNLSRNTVSNIVNNTHANISNRTLDTLCMFLNVEPSEIYEYQPFNITPVFYVDWDNDLSKNDNHLDGEYMLSARVKFFKLGVTLATVNLSGTIEELENYYDGDEEILYSGKITFSTKDDDQLFRKLTKDVSQFAVSDLARYLHNALSHFLTKEGRALTAREENKIVFKLE